MESIVEDKYVHHERALSASPITIKYSLSPIPIPIRLLSTRVSARGSARGEKTEAPSSSRVAAGPETSRSTGRSSHGGETYRTSMDTARVYTVVAALSAEKQSLLAKLSLIDSALEAGKKKGAVKPPRG